MKMSLGEVRSIISRIVSESANPNQLVARNVLSPATNNREQLGAIKAQPMDTVDNVDEMPDHLFEPEVAPQDCYGPVPPTADKIYVTQDPQVKDLGPGTFGRNAKSGF